MDDIELLTGCRNGNKDYFAELVTKYSRPIMTMIFRMVQNREDAEDLTQTVFMKAYEAVDKFEMASTFKTWLYTIAVNQVRDWAGKRKITIADSEMQLIADPADRQDDVLDRLKRARDVRRAVELLPEKQRITLQLRMYEELDYARIGEIMKCSEGAARVNFFQAIKSLRKKLGES